MTSAQLVGGDVDGAFDVYDAHECSGGVPCASGVVVAPPACDTADSCRAAPMAQPVVFGAPASATFSGPGNATPAVRKPARSAAQLRAEKLSRALKACRRDKSRRRRVVCERRARKAYGVARKASKTARAVRAPGVAVRLRVSSEGRVR